MRTGCRTATFNDVLLFLALCPALLTSAVVTIARWAPGGSRHALHRASLFAMLFWCALAAMCVAVMALDQRDASELSWWALLGFVPMLVGAFVAFMSFVASPQLPAVPRRL